ncbi:MAG TPA: PepSY domain-containing protein [Gemmatimonadaceae bacterium]|nr:PepSY domain-containing protein [Gemmatimonadaceae bacterium]
MRFRNTIRVLALAAMPFAATALAAQSSTSKPAAQAQQRMARHAATAKQEASASLAISPDSARRIALTNLPGATVKREKLGRNGGKQAYMFTLTANGRTSRAAVDAETGAFTQVAPHSARANRTHGTANKKPSRR